MLPSNNNVGTGFRNHHMQNQDLQKDNKLSANIAYARSISTNEFQAFLLVEKDIPTDINETESSLLERFQNISNQLTTRVQIEKDSKKIVHSSRKISPKTINSMELTHTLGKYWRFDSNNNNNSETDQKNNVISNNKNKIYKAIVLDEPSYKSKKSNNSIKKINPHKKKMESPKKIKAKVIKKGELKNPLESYRNPGITHNYHLNNYGTYNSSNDDKALRIFEEANKRYDNKEYQNAANMYLQALDLVNGGGILSIERKSLHNYLYFCYFTLSKSEQSLSEKLKFIEQATPHLEKFLRLQNGSKKESQLNTDEKSGIINVYVKEVTDLGFRLINSENKYKNAFSCYKLSLDILLKNKKYINGTSFNDFGVDSLYNLTVCMSNSTENIKLCNEMDQALTDILEECRKNNFIDVDVSQEYMKWQENFQIENLDGGPEDCLDDDTKGTEIPSSTPKKRDVWKIEAVERGEILPSKKSKKSVD